MIKFGGLVLVLSCAAYLVSGVPQLGRDYDIGDECQVKDGSKGTCTIDKDCPYVIDLLKRNKSRDIVKCGFSGRYSIVCCKSSDKFSKLLCKENVDKIPSKPVRLEKHIIRGEQAEAAEFPHFAAIGFGGEVDPYDFNCGGTLITDSVVLTAAHCCDNKARKPLIVRVGKTSLKDNTDEEEGQDIKIKDIVINQNYSRKTNLNDIALLKLERPVNLKHNVWPACVSSSTHGLMTDLAIIGFGRINNDDQSTSDWLLKANSSEISLTSCQETFQNIPKARPIGSTQLCVLNPEKFSDTCQGDSGGPLQYKKNNLYFVYGIVSYGYGCGSELPSIYTRVDQYLNWIETNIS